MTVPVQPLLSSQRHLDADEVGSSYFESTNHALKLAWRSEDSLWQFQYGLQDIPEQGWVNQRMDMTRNDSEQWNLSLTQEYYWGSFDGRISKILSETDEGGTYTLATGFSYTDGTNRDTGDNLAQIMPLTIDVSLNHSIGSWNHDFELQLVGERDEVSEVRNEIATDSYTLLNARGSYNFSDDLRLDYGIENIFDEYYEHPLSGAYTGQGKTMNGTGIAWGQRVPGKGRNIYMGVTYDF